MLHDLRLLAFILLFGAAVAACSGGGGTLTPQASGGGEGIDPQLNQMVTFRVLIPAAPSDSARTRHSRDTVYVSPNTSSIGIQLSTVNGKSLTEVPPASVSNVTPACIGSSSGCTVVVPNVKAAAGNDAFSVTTYTGKNATGAIISQGIVPVTVSGDGSSATVGGTTLSIGGFVAKLDIKVNPPQFYIGEASNANVYVVAEDASGAVIIGNTKYAVPITVSASPSPQFQLIFGVTQGTTVTLNGPEQAGSLVRLRYNGSTQVSTGTVAASSLNSAGAAITANANISVIPAPSPTPSGPPPATDVYVLNGVDNTVAEFVPGGSQFTQRRVFGGKVIGCTPALQGAFNLTQVSLGASGLAFDGGRNTLVGSGYTCGKPGAVERFYSLAPDAVATATPNAVYSTQNQNVLSFVGFAFDPTLQYLDVSDGSTNVYMYEYRLSGNQANQAAALGQTGGAPTCFRTPGAGGCGNQEIAPGTFTTYEINKGYLDQYGRTFALDGQGLGYYPAINTILFNFNMLQLSMANEPPSGPALANAVWMAGITPYSQNYGPADANRMDYYPVGMAVDGSILYVLIYPTNQKLFNTSGTYPVYEPPAGLCDSNPQATPEPWPGSSKCADGQIHEFLTAYDLSKLTASGPVNLQPILVLGGDQLPGGTAAGGAFANRLAVGGGNIYITEPVGAVCNASCFGSLGSGPIGRIVVYPETLRGSHINDGASNPSATIQGTNIRFPTGVSLGPQGTSQGSFAKKRH